MKHFRFKNTEGSEMAQELLPLLKLARPSIEYSVEKNRWGGPHPVLVAFLPEKGRKGPTRSIETHVGPPPKGKVSLRLLSAEGVSMNDSPGSRLHIDYAKEYMGAEYDALLRRVKKFADTVKFALHMEQARAVYLARFRKLIGSAGLEEALGPPKNVLFLGDGKAYREHLPMVEWQGLSIQPDADGEINFTLDIRGPMRQCAETMEFFLEYMEALEESRARIRPALKEASRVYQQTLKTAENG